MSKRLDALRPPELKQLVVFEVFPQRESKEVATAERLAQREAEQERADWLQAQKERQRAALLRKPKGEP